MSTVDLGASGWRFSLASGYQKLRSGLRHQRLRRKARRWTDEDATRQAFYGGFITPGSLVFDVGANQGNRTKVFLRLGARVVAIDPQGECVEFMRDVFGDHEGLGLEQTAVGAEPGEATMRLSKHSTIGTLANDWVESVSSSGRFDKSLWEGEVQVPVTTLDALIARHGVPQFMKIDVEGFELEVLRGLSQPVPAVSLEFIPEELDKAIACIDRLETLGSWDYQISLGESMVFTTPDRKGRDEAIELLRKVPADQFGDLYAFSA